jgi:putative transposase
VLQQQARFDAFVDEYNHERPHQGLDMKVPADFYEPSPRVYRGLEELTYPFHDTTMTVTNCGRICFKGRKVNLSHALAGQNVGVTQVGDRIGSSASCNTTWDISTMRPAGWNRSRIPFGSKVLPMSRNKLSPM